MIEKCKMNKIYKNKKYKKEYSRIKKVGKH